MVSIPVSTPEQANQSCMRKVGDNKDVVGVRDKSLTAYPTVPKSTVSHFNEVNRWFAASSGILEGLWDDNNRVHVAKQSDVDGRLDSGSGATWLFLLPVHPIFNVALLLVVGCQSCFLSAVPLCQMNLTTACCGKMKPKIRNWQTRQEIFVPFFFRGMHVFSK